MKRAPLALLFVLACGRDGAPSPAAENAALGGEVGARVGPVAIPLSVIASVARAQNLSARDAARRVVDDEIAAAAARERKLDLEPSASWRLRSVRGRFVSDRIFDEARRKGPPNEEEVQGLSQVHWQEVDRPPSFRVIHVIVLRPKEADLLEKAPLLAGEMRRAVLATTTAAEFEAAAKALAPPKGTPKTPALETKVEALPAFTDDGWVVEGQGNMDPIFAKATTAIGDAGVTSPVVETPFGWHVIRLLEILPEKRMPLDVRRLAFADEAYAHRARETLQRELDRLKRSHPVMVSEAAEALMLSVSNGAAETPGRP